MSTQISESEAASNFEATGNCEMTSCQSEDVTDFSETVSLRSTIPQKSKENILRCPFEFSVYPDVSD